MKYLVIFTFLLSSPFLKAQDLVEFIPFANGLNEPVDIVNAGDSMLYIVEKPGLIRLIDPDGNVTSEPFLNITDRVNDNRSERGLLGLVFHPAYPDSPYLYVNYTANGNGSTVISRFEVNQNDLTQAIPASENILLTFSQPFWNHNAGDLAFGPDGYLYIPTGDGGSGGDPQGNAQNLMSFLGKILRIDVDNGSPYAIPSDNPFADDDFALDEIWAYGMRNPWRIDFDPMTGDLYIGDVGQDKYEEIDFQPATSLGGENYGWRCYEGDSIYNDTNCDESGFTYPVHVYNRPSQNICASITGGVVYYGSENSGWYGKYLFSDFCTGMVGALYRDDMDNWVVDSLLVSDQNGLSTFGRDVHGEVYVASPFNGRIFKLKEKGTAVRYINSERKITVENPVKNLLVIDRELDFDGGTLHDLQGRLIKNMTPNTYEINVSSCTPGIYLISLHHKNKIYNQKVIIL